MAEEILREWKWMYDDLFVGLHHEPDGGIEAMIERLEERAKWLQQGVVTGRCIDVDSSTNYILIQESPSEQWEYVTTSNKPESTEEICDELRSQAEWLREGEKEGGYVEYEGRNEYAMNIPLN